MTRPNKFKWNYLMIKVVGYKGKLRLVIPRKYYPKRYFNLDLPDEKVYYPIAFEMKRKIELDILVDEFDQSLDKYQEKDINLLFIWEFYFQFKVSQLQPSSVRNLKTVSNLLNNIEPQILFNGSSLKLFLVQNLSNEQSRRILTQIRASYRYAIEIGLTEINPFKDIKLPKKRQRKQIDPFSKNERLRIIEGFKNSEYYSYHSYFVEFLFLTGCRPSEAVGLKWESVGDDFIIFKEAVVEGKRKDCTKTYVDRKFPINQQLKQLILTIPRRGKQVFYSKEGMLVNLNNFNRRAWDSVLTSEVVRYRSPYKARHTFITEMLKLGIPVAVVADWVGNSPEIIYRYYAGVTNMGVPIL